MRLGVDVRIHPQGDGGHPVFHAGHPGDRLELGFTLDVEHQDAGIEPGRDLGVGLAHAREDRLGRVAPGQTDAVELASGDDVEAAAMLGHHLEQAQVRVRFHRIADQGIDLGEGPQQVVQRAQNGCLAIDEKRCAESGGQLDHRNILAIKLTAAVVKGFHGSSGMVKVI